MFEPERLSNNLDRHSQYFGKYAGVVVDNAVPPEGAHRGEIKVRVPSILEETADGKGNQPLEVIAAPSFLPGFFFIPEIESPVWVEFVAGDINHPIWTGVWYPKDATPKNTAGEAPTEKQKVIRTASGQVIQLDDTDDKKGIILRDEEHDSTITLNTEINGIEIDHAKTSTALINDDGITLVFNNQSTEAKVTINADGIVIAHGELKIMITDTGIEIKVSDGNKIVIDNSSLEIKAAGRALKLDASGTKLDGKYIVLEPLIDWLMTHMHVGNLGAPTAPPQPPPVKPANVSM